VVGGGVAGEGGRVAGEEQPHRVAGPLEVPGHHETVAAVVAPAADDGDRRAGSQIMQQGGGVAARVLHQHDARQAELLDRPAIDVAHLGAGQRPHGDLPAACPRPRQRSLQ